MLIIGDLQIFQSQQFIKFQIELHLSYTTQRNKKKKSFPKNFPADILNGDPLHIENFLFTPSRIFPFSLFL